MSKMIQIRNVPDELHRELKAAAAREGVSLSDYLLRELQSIGRRSDWDDIWERMDQYPGLKPGAPDPVDLIRRDRDSN